MVRAKRCQRGRWERPLAEGERVCVVVCKRLRPLAANIVLITPEPEQPQAPQLQLLHRPSYSLTLRLLHSGFLAFSYSLALLAWCLFFARLFLHSFPLTHGFTFPSYWHRLKTIAFSFHFGGLQGLRFWFSLAVQQSGAGNPHSWSQLCQVVVIYSSAPFKTCFRSLSEVVGKVRKVLLVKANIKRYSNQQDTGRLKCLTMLFFNNWLKSLVQISYFYTSLAVKHMTEDCRWTKCTISNKAGLINLIQHVG